MSEIFTKKYRRMYKVEFMESERGFGVRYEYEVYDTEKEALSVVERCNKSNIEESVPDWYMVATYLGAVDIEI